jgi:hypothetical protein
MRNAVVAKFSLSIVCLTVLSAVFGAGSHSALAVTSSSAPSARVDQKQRFSPRNEESVSCWPADIVLLMDQSQSMISYTPFDAPSAQRNPPSDPNNYRVTGAIEVLTTLLYHRRDRCPQAIHRFGLVTFGNRADVIMPLSQLDVPAQREPEAWASQYFDKILAAAKDNTQTATDFVKAFKSAEQMFAQAGSMPDVPGYGPRKKVIILLTDGNPAGVGDTQQYACSMVDYLNSSAWDGFGLWVVALDASGPYLDNQGCNGVIRNNWQSIVEKHDGELDALPYNESKIPALLNLIIQKIIGKGHVIDITCGETFYVDPYLKSVEFHFSETQPQKGPKFQVTLEKLNDQGNPIYQVTGGSAEVKPEDQIGTMVLQRYSVDPSEQRTETYVFGNPRPGAWRFNVKGLSPNDCKRLVTAQEASLIADHKLVEPIQMQKLGQPRVVAYAPDAPYYDKEHPARFAVRLSSESGTPITEERNYPLQIEIIYRLPSGKDALPNGDPVNAIMLSAEEPGLWVSENPPLLAPELGVYDVSITGTTLNGAMTTTLVVFTQTAQYEARKLEHYSFTIESPIANASVPCNDVVNGRPVNRTLPVAVQLRNEVGDPADPAFCAISPPEFQAMATGVSDTPLDTITLTARTGAMGMFVGDLLTNITGVTSCDTLTVGVSFIGDYDREKCVIPVQPSNITTGRIGVPVTRLLATGVTVSITNPPANAGLNIYPHFGDACWGGGPQAVPLEVMFFDLNGKVLNPSDLASTSPTTLLSGRLVGPDLQSWETLTFTLQPTPQGGKLVALGGLSLTQKGEYYFEITPQQSAFKSNFVVTSDVLKVSFDRTDAFPNNGASCQAAQAGAVVFALAALVALVIALTGGAGGSIELVRSGTNTNIAGPFRVSKARAFRLIRNKALQQFGIKHINVTKAQSLEGKSRAANIAVYGTDGGPLCNYSNVEVDGQLPLDADVDIIYH